MKEKKVEYEEESTRKVDLKALIHDHATFFDKLVELIPAKFYLPTDDDDDKPWFQGLSKSQKALSKKETKANVKRARRDRLDPEKSSATTLDLLQQKLEKEKKKVNVEEEEEEEEEEEKVNDEDDDEKVNDGEEAKAALSGFDEEPEEGSNQRSRTYEELRHRLHLKIEACRSERNTGCSKREQKRLGRRDGMGAAQRGGGSGGGPPKRKRAAEAPLLDPTEALNGLEFGKIKLDDSSNKNNNKKRKLSKSQELKRAEEVRGRGGGDMAERAEIRAAGGKVHDDPGILRKSIRKEKRKSQKSAQQWKDRVQNKNRAMAEKQRKRSDNINKKKDEKKQRKIDKREKKLMRPGFEGRKESTSA